MRRVALLGASAVWKLEARMHMQEHPLMSAEAGSSRFHSFRLRIREKRNRCSMVSLAEEMEEVQHQWEEVSGTAWGQEEQVAG